MEDSKLKEDDVRSWLKDEPTLSDYVEAPFGLARQALSDLHPVARHGVATTAYGLGGLMLVIGSNYVTGGWGFLQGLLLVLATGLTIGSCYSGCYVLANTPTQDRLSKGAEIGSFFATVGNVFVTLTLVAASILFPAHNDYYQMDETVLPALSKYKAAIQKARQNDQPISLGSFVANGQLPASACDAMLVRNDEEINCGVAGDQQLKLDYGPQHAQVGFEETEDGALIRFGNMDREDYRVLKRRLGERAIAEGPRLQPAGYQNNSGYVRMPEPSESSSTSLSSYQAELHAEQLRTQTRIERMEALMAQAIEKGIDRLGGPDDEGASQNEQPSSATK